MTKKRIFKVLLNIITLFFISFFGVLSTNAFYKEIPNNQIIKINFYRDNLTKDEIKKMRYINSEYINNIKNINLLMGLSNNEKVLRIKKIQEQYINDILPFIKPGLEESFKNWILSRDKFIYNKDIKNIENGKRLEKIEKNTKQKNNKYTILKPDIINKLNDKLDSLPEDKRDLIFKALIKKINTLIEQTNDPVKKAILEDIEVVVIEKILFYNKDKIRTYILYEALSKIKK